MSLDFSNTLVVGISATALSDLSAYNALFQKQFAEDRKKAMLSPGKLYRKRKPPLVEVVVMSRNSQETGLRVLSNIRKRGSKRGNRIYDILWVTIAP